MRFRWERQSRVSDAARGITPRRLAAARRFLKKERDKMPLFSDQIAAEQPTPEQRIERHDERFMAKMQYWRDERAKRWKACRKRLRVMQSMDPELAATVLALWNQSGVPGGPEYLAGYLTRKPKEIKERHAAGDRWYVFRKVDGEGFKFLMCDENFARIAATTVAGPFDSFPEIPEEYRG